MGQEALRDYLSELFASEGGAISFERFMGEALYHAKHGYYTRHIETVGGRRADFATAPTLSPVLGQAVASWLRGERELHGFEGDRSWSVIEVGGGDGQMAQAVLETLSWRERRSLRYHLVEVSPVLESQQRELLGRRARRVTWHRTIETALEAAGGRALVFSNELVDAFPVMLLVGNGEGKGFSEVWLEYEEGEGLRESFRPLDDARLGLPENKRRYAIFDHPDFQVEGQRLEVHRAYFEWLEQWAPSLVAGSVLTIDYGDEVAAIYGKRPRGTLRSYHRHQRAEGAYVYRWFGRQDITCDVNFTDLKRAGEALGWETLDWETQAAFLRRHLDERKLNQGRETAFVLDPEGSGGAFKVLSQRVGETGR